MPSWFNLRLDTHAPVITWGPVDGTDQGAELVQLYSIDEPAVVSAELELADGRVLPMSVQSNALLVQLPEDTPEGPATIRAFVSDDVANTATRTTVVQLTGVPFEPPPQPTGPPALPSLGPDRPAPVLKRSPPSVMRLTAVHRLRARAIDTGDDILMGWTRWMAPNTYPAMPWMFWSDATVSSRSRTTARVVMRDSAAASSTTRVYKRPEGPGHEDELFELGIL